VPWALSLLKLAPGFALRKAADEAVLSLTGVVHCCHG